MTLTVRDLKEMLDGLDEDLEVRFASQPNYPFEYSIDKVELVDLNGLTEKEFQEMCDEPEREGIDDVDEREVKEVVYLSEGEQIGYLPPVVCETLGWR